MLKPVPIPNNYLYTHSHKHTHTRTVHTRTVPPRVSLHTYTTKQNYPRTHTGRTHTGLVHYAQASAYSSINNNYLYTHTCEHTCELTHVHKIPLNGVSTLCSSQQASAYSSIITYTHTHAQYHHVWAYTRTGLVAYSSINNNYLYTHTHARTVPPRVSLHMYTTKQNYPRTHTA